MQELAYQRNLSVIVNRQRAINEHQEEDLGRSKIEQARGALRNTLAGPLSWTQKHDLCSLCTCEFKVGTHIKLLGCHPHHKLHENCYDQLINFEGAGAKCPLCRKEID